MRNGLVSMATLDRFPAATPTQKSLGPLTTPPHVTFKTLNVLKGTFRA
jgi:hypothetical protein